MLFEDQLAALEADSQQLGTQGDELDFALLARRPARPSASRASRSTSPTASSRPTAQVHRRRHARATSSTRATWSPARRPPTARSILIDARKGVLTQTRRHSYLVSLLGIRHVVLAVNKMDLVDYSQERLRRDRARLPRVRRRDRPRGRHLHPAVGADGRQRRRRRATNMPWYDGPDADASTSRPSRSTRSACSARRSACRCSGSTGPTSTSAASPARSRAARSRPATAIVVLPSGQTSEVARIVTYDGDLDEAVAGQSVTLTLDRRDRHQPRRRDRDGRRTGRASPTSSRRRIVWMAEEPMLPGPHLPAEASATRTRRRHGRAAQVQASTSTRSSTSRRRRSSSTRSASCNLELDRPIAFDPYAREPRHRRLHPDRPHHQRTRSAPACSTSRCAARTNIHWQAVDVDKARARRAQAARRRASCGSPASPARASRRSPTWSSAKLHALGRHTYLLDGDNVRHGLNKDLGFTDADRVENIRRVAEVARLMVDAGLIVLVSFISPFRAERRLAREPGRRRRVRRGLRRHAARRSPRQRDPKGLYAKARRGELQQLHRHRLALRAARAPRAAHRHERAHGRGRRRRRDRSCSSARASSSPLRRGRSGERRGGRP